MLKFVRYFCVISTMMMVAMSQCAVTALAQNSPVHRVDRQMQRIAPPVPNHFSNARGQKLNNYDLKKLTGLYSRRVNMNARQAVNTRQSARQRVRVQQYAQTRSANQRSISPSRAKSIAMRYANGAKFINVQLVGPSTYRVRLQINARIIDVYVDAHTGQVRN